MLHETDRDLFDVTTLLSAKDRDCRNPTFDLEDGNIQVCGKPALPGLPYCLECAKINYQNFGQVKK